MEGIMRPLVRVTVAALGALALSACATTNVRSFVERGVDVRQYRTYTWGPADQQATGDPRLDNNEFFAKRMQSAVDRQLADRGFVKVGRTPDLLIHFHANVEQQINPNGADRPYTSCEDCDPYVFDAGTIVVDLVDARTHRLVWRGWEEGSIDGVVDNQTWMEKRVDESVAKILKNLPRALEPPPHAPAPDTDPEAMCSPLI
jgi:hypothetical protein